MMTTTEMRQALKARGYRVTLSRRTSFTRANVTAVRAYPETVVVSGSGDTDAEAFAECLAKAPR